MKSDLSNYTFVAQRGKLERHLKNYLNVELSNFFTESPIIYTKGHYLNNSNQDQSFYFL